MVLWECMIIRLLLNTGPCPCKDNAGFFCLFVCLYVNVNPWSKEGTEAVFSLC